MKRSISFILFCTFANFALNVLQKVEGRAVSSPKSVGRVQSHHGSVSRADVPLLNSRLTDIFDQVAQDPVLNENLANGLNEFMGTLREQFPAIVNCQQLKEMKVGASSVWPMVKLMFAKKDFFRSISSTDLGANPEVVKSMDEVITQVLPALCRSQSPNGSNQLINQAGLMNHLKKLGDWIGENGKNSMGAPAKARQDKNFPRYSTLSPDAFDIPPEILEKLSGRQWNQSPDY
ncbi:hypothetical protein DdX_00228 [Ditylenchus destructor]|uniref:Uncharacterized protein n=1 Tax=Ditylenchus destructor TaxID=166010 RepID=A0AAD4RD48_9BILA|nr:hypothetical protein DdX_00228 [Ditylenchus destructor]